MFDDSYELTAYSCSSVHLDNMLMNLDKHLYIFFRI
jgi:hypothetical protein